MTRGSDLRKRNVQSLRARAHSAKRVIATANPSVRLSVLLSRSGIVPRRMKIGSCGLQSEVAQTL